MRPTEARPRLLPVVPDGTLEDAVELVLACRLARRAPLALKLTRVPCAVPAAALKLLVAEQCGPLEHFQSFAAVGGQYNAKAVPYFGTMAARFCKLCAVAQFRLGDAGRTFRLGAALRKQREDDRWNTAATSSQVLAAATSLLGPGGWSSRMLEAHDSEPLTVARPVSVGPRAARPRLVGPSFAAPPRPRPRVPAPEPSVAAVEVRIGTVARVVGVASRVQGKAPRRRRLEWHARDAALRRVEASFLVRSRGTGAPLQAALVGAVACPDADAAPPA